MTDPMPRKDLGLPPTKREAELIAERDAALARAEKAEAELARWATHSELRRE